MHNDDDRDVPDFIKDHKGFLRPRFTWGDFLALSYVWGDDVACHAILLNGKKFMVRANLLEALRRLRNSVEVKKAKLKVWVDAICINQGDMDERAFQVQNMRTIYGRALCVRGWVGAPPAGARSDFANLFKTMRKLTATLTQTTKWRRKRGLDRATPASTWRLAELSDAELRRVGEAFRSVTAAPYWERLWVVQEMAMVVSLVFWHGDAWFNRSQLSSMFDALHKERLRRGWKSQANLNRTHFLT